MIGAPPAGGMPAIQRTIRPVGDRLALAIGNFDGVHVGHLGLLRRLAGLARVGGMVPSVMTFEPHPHRLFFPDRPHMQICGFRQKVLLLGAAGVRRVVVPRFDAAFAKTEPEQFLELLGPRMLNVGALVVGADYRFGRARRGDVGMLQAGQDAHGYRLEIVGDVKLGGERVASRKIRQAVREGDFGEAERMLGRPYSISGKVVRGAGIGGSRLGFPTINLNCRHTPPCEGVYCAQAELEGVDGPLVAALSIGRRPAVGPSGPVTVEAHLPGFSGDVYGRRAEVRPLAKIREERDFPSMGELREAIAADVREVVRLSGERRGCAGGA